ncbi:hypothetical protein L7F22_046812 [Adiantum nelumboides]|nr:hypothetical protein [Adiantum nelumboides]
MDFIFDLPRTQSGHDGIWTIIDRFSKQAHFVPVKKTVKPDHLARLFVAQIFRLHGMPETCISDRDPKFSSLFWKAIWENIGTRLQFSSSFHPQTDGQSEIANLVVLDLLKSYILDQKTQWERYLPLVEFAYNNTIHSSTGKAPFEIVEGAMKVPPFLSTKDKIFEADESRLYQSAGTGWRKWSCKYCGFTMSSTITRVVMHLTGINCTNNCGKCKLVPPGVREALIAGKFPAFATTDKGKVTQQTQDRLQDALLGQLGDSSTQVGVYGYAAYSASKFGLKGMAEALQQEIHCYNIRVSIIYPPDTFTPGLAKENETKPEITKVISGCSTAMDAVDVARKAVDGIKAGNFSISCNFDGWMLCIATAGMSPQPSTVLAFAEIFLSGILRLVGLCYIWTWYQTLVKWTKQHNKDK